MSDERPILVLTASAGAGHTTAARAIEQELRLQARRVPIEVHDALAHTNAFFRTLYARGYLGMVNYAPVAMGLLYEATDRPQRFLRNNLRGGFQNMNAHRFMRFLVQRRPRLIVNTHFLPAEIVAHLRRRKKLLCPQVTVTTDFETHRLWAHDPTERYYTATEEGAAYLTTWNVPAVSIRATGIPVRSEFEQPLDRAAARRRLELSDTSPVVLLLSGGFGVGPTEQLYGELVAMSNDAQIAVVTGRNENLRRRLEVLAKDSTRSLRIVGFTDEMHVWMRAADVVVTKPGGLTTSEALVCELPVVVVNPIPGQETRNSDFLLEHGAAIKVNNPRLLGFRVARLLADAARLAELRTASRRIARPGAAGRIVADALSLMH